MSSTRKILNSSKPKKTYTDQQLAAFARQYRVIYEYYLRNTPSDIKAQEKALRLEIRCYEKMKKLTNEYQKKLVYAENIYFRYRTCQDIRNIKKQTADIIKKENLDDDDYRTLSELYDALSPLYYEMKKYREQREVIQLAIGCRKQIKKQKDSDIDFLEELGDDLRVFKI